MGTVALYIRVSTDEQAEYGTSVDVQKERLIAYASSQGWGETKLYIDDGYTGTNLDRPALKRLVRHVERGEIATVVVYKLDRLGRSQKDVLFLLEDVFDKNNVAFKSSTEPFDTSTSLGKAMLGILAVFAQLERDMIVERTTAGRRQRIKQGKWPGGRIPFGYEHVDGRLTIIPHEAELLREIYRRYLRGDSRLTISEWAKTRSKARTFDHNIIRDMLSRPVYCGLLQTEGKLIEGEHEAIIDKELWDAVQAETYKRSKGRAPIGEYLLTGLLECGECGDNIVHVKRKTTRRGKTYLYELYACRNQHVREKDRTVPKCFLGYTRRDKLEKYIIRLINKYRLDPQQLIIDSEKVDHADATSALKRRKEKLINELDNLYDAIQSGAIKASRVSSRISDLEEERESIEVQLDDLAEDMEVDNSDEVIEALNQLGNAWSYLEVEEQKQLLRRIVKRIRLKKDDDPLIFWNL